ncbi:TauD/TfdA family dioxygenase [Rhodococcus baikonurensis]
MGELIGARIDGVHLSGDLSEETAYAINYALAAHKVVFFQGQQHLDDTSQYEFAGTLGTQTTPHPTVKSRGDKLLVLDRAANSWHTDVTFVDRIPKASILRATTIPEYGGATTWASTTAAYDQLPPSLKVFVENLRAVHTNAYDYAEVANQANPVDPERLAYYAEFTREIYETEHPVVRIHPATGRRPSCSVTSSRSSSGSSRPSRSLSTRSSRRESSSWKTLFDGTGRRRPGDLGQPGDSALRDRRLRDSGPQCAPSDIGGDVPVDVHGEQSRILQGDAAEYSIIADIDRLPASPRTDQSCCG